MATGESFPGGKTAEAWSWPLISIWCQGQRMNGAIPPLLQYVLVEWYLVKHRDKLTLPYVMLCYVSVVLSGDGTCSSFGPSDLACSEQ